MLLIFCSGAWIAGILLGAVFAPPPTLLLVGLAPLPLLFWLRNQMRTIILASACILLCVGGAVYYEANLPSADMHSLQFYNDGGTSEIKGIISSPPEVRDRTTHIRLSATVLNTDAGWQKVKGRALLFVPRSDD